MSRVHTFGYPRIYIHHKTIEIKYPRSYLGGKRDKFFRFHKIKAGAPRHFRAKTSEYEGELRTAVSHVFRFWRWGVELGRWRDSGIDWFSTGDSSNGWVDGEQRHLAGALRASFGRSEADDETRGAGTPELIGNIVRETDV